MSSFFRFWCCIDLCWLCNVSEWLNVDVADFLRLLTSVLSSTKLCFGTWDQLLNFSDPWLDMSIESIPSILCFTSVCSSRILTISVIDINSEVTLNNSIFKFVQDRHLRSQLSGLSSVNFASTSWFITPAAMFQLWVQLIESSPKSILILPHVYVQFFCTFWQTHCTLIPLYWSFWCDNDTKKTPFLYLREAWVRVLSVNRSRHVWICSEDTVSIGAFSYQRNNTSLDTFGRDHIRLNSGSNFSLII